MSNAFGNNKFERVRNRFIELGIPKDLRALILHLLEDRIISYETETHKINIKLTKGAPQGSPLSPFLWNVIISELLTLEMPANTTIQAFADDLTITVRGKVD